MTKHDFVFSARLRYRAARQIIFWTIWSLSFNLIFHWPTHVFRGWDVTANGATSAKPQTVGLTFLFFKTLIINSWLAVIVPQILFTTALIYWILPAFFYKRSNIVSTLFALGCLVAAYFFIAVGFKYAVPLYNYLSGIYNKPIAFASMTHVVLIDQLTTLPIAAGFAVMIKLIKRWWLKQKQAEELSREKIRAELQLLKAQIHPHFLFNTLNNIYFFALNASPKAPQMIKKLSGLLKYILYECNQQWVPLEKEINMISDYMALEKIRYGEQMEMTVEIVESSLSGEGARNRLISPLLLVPFVENSFKHGTSEMISRPFVKLRMEIDGAWLNFSIINSRPAIYPSLTVKGNIGLKNVKKRLKLLYPGEHELKITSEGETFAVNLRVRLYDNHVAFTYPEKINLSNAYVVA
jgi:sensor histidine kinase YesM